MTKQEKLRFVRAAITLINSLDLKVLTLNFNYSYGSSPYISVYNSDVSEAKLFHFWTIEPLKKSQETFREVFRRLKTDDYSSFGDMA